MKHELSPLVNNKRIELFDYKLVEQIYDIFKSKFTT